MMGLEGALELAEVQAHWEEVAGEAVAAHAWPTALRQGVLTVAVDHHAWAAELRLALRAPATASCRCPAQRSRPSPSRSASLPPQDPSNGGPSW